MKGAGCDSSETLLVACWYAEVKKYSMIFAPGCILAQFQGKIAFRVPLKIVQAIVIPKQHHQASDPPDKDIGQDIGRPADGTFSGAFLPMFYLCSMHFFIFL